LRRESLIEKVRFWKTPRNLLIARVTWLIGLLICIAVLIWYIIFNVQMYQDSKKNPLLVNSRAQESIVGPVVAICINDPVQTTLPHNILALDSSVNPIPVNYTRIEDVYYTELYGDYQSESCALINQKQKSPFNVTHVGNPGFFISSSNFPSFNVYFFFKNDSRLHDADFIHFNGLHIVQNTSLIIDVEKDAIVYLNGTRFSFYTPSIRSTISSVNNGFFMIVSYNSFDTFIQTETLPVSAGQLVGIIFGFWGFELTVLHYVNLLFLTLLVPPYNNRGVWDVLMEDV